MFVIFLRSNWHPEFHKVVLTIEEFKNILSPAFWSVSVLGVSVCSKCVVLRHTTSAV